MKLHMNFYEIPELGDLKLPDEEPQQTNSC